MPLRSVIFDLDQTLVDSSAVEVYRGLQLWDEVIGHLDQIHLYDGVTEIFATCRAASIKIGVVTASPRHICEAVLARVGLQVDAIVASGESKFGKPSPHPVWNVLKLLHHQSADAMVVGDRCIDIASGSNAEIGWTVAAMWGARNRRSLILSNPTFIAENVSDAGLLIAGLLDTAQFQPWLDQREQEAKAEFEGQMWVAHDADIDRGHLGDGHFPYFFCRNRVRGIWTASYANALVNNLKAAVAQGGQPAAYKLHACQQMANELAHLIRTCNLQNVAVAFIPGSKRTDHAEYDPRFEYVGANLIEAGFRVAAPIVTSISHEAVHNDDNYQHRSPHVVRQHLTWEGFEDPVPINLFLVDDVLTSGGHFRACVEMIREHHPQMNISGAFWAAHLSE